MPTVVYSTDADCHRGPDLAARLASLGLARVHLYTDGIEGWVSAGHRTEPAASARG